MIIDEARKWLGTPYRHQHRAIGIGCDCVNLVIAVGLDLGLTTLTDEQYAPFKGYSRLPNPRMMKRGIEVICREIESPEVGDIMWLQWGRGLPMHMAILSEMNGRPTMIHAYSGAGKVVEHGFTAEWQNRVNSWWRYKGLVDG